MGFTAACSGLNYVAEVPGQVAIGTGVYGVVRQIADLASAWWNQRALCSALALSLHDYMAAATARRKQPRDSEVLAARIRELRDLRPVRERDHFDRALRELADHGTAGEYALLGDDLSMVHLQALAARLARW
ncbi:MAG: hypothetical protein E6J90_40685 [Deltaproteobacteria bacterium]|nr:MAG: hypothetical protein E6J91_53300 [Deltaproteobacteria bacterium]TMQ08355.1 MAG: hypothetical protein E6J90_40685 [Deltaproteobacteria bacterium]